MLSLLPLNFFRRSASHTFPQMFTIVHASIFACPVSPSGLPYGAEGSRVPNVTISHLERLLSLHDLGGSNQDEGMLFYKI